MSQQLLRISVLQRPPRLVKPGEAEMKQEVCRLDLSHSTGPVFHPQLVFSSNR
jgi:hypothetical protein